MRLTLIEYTIQVDENGSVREVASLLKPTMAACSVVLPGRIPLLPTIKKRINAQLNNE